jgi:hypothetical protein
LGEASDLRVSEVVRFRHEDLDRDRGLISAATHLLEKGRDMIE